MKRLLLVAVTVLASSAAFATYNANMYGEVDAILTYPDDDSILIHLKNQPSSHPTCNPGYFAIDGSVPVDRRKAMYARVLLAYANGETLNIGYDNAGTCSSTTYIRVYRVG